MSEPGYISNAELAQRLSNLVNRWDTREDQLIALLSKATGTVNLTDRLGVTTSVASYKQLLSDVTEALDNLNGVVAASQDAANAALQSEVLAYKYAEHPTDTEVSPGVFSAKHWATKAISTLTDIEEHLLAEGGTYDFDCDPANIDDGVTDPYKFVTLSALLASVLELIPTLPLADNVININLADGDYNPLDLAVFLAHGAAGGLDGIWAGAPGIVDNANAKIYFNSKSTPTAIPNNAWTLISSAANDTAERPAAEIANRAVILANFPCRFRFDNADWHGNCIYFGGNCSTNGIAYVANAGTPLNYVNLRIPHVGPKGVAIFGGAPYYTLEAPAKKMIFSPYLHYLYNAEGCKFYIAHGGCETQNLCPESDDLTVIMVNPAYPVRHIGDPALGATCLYNWGKFVCLGTYKPANASYGWINICDHTWGDLSLRSGSVLPASGVFCTITNNTAVPLKFSCSTASGSPYGCSIENLSASPVCVQNFSAFATAWPNRKGAFSERIPGASPPQVLSGSSAPETYIVGTPGDLYQRTAGGTGTTLYVKESGSNTKTGWRALGAAAPGGSDTQVQFNDGGVFFGSSGFTYNKTTSAVTVSPVGNSAFRIVDDTAVPLLSVQKPNGGYGSPAVAINGGSRTNQPALSLVNLGAGVAGISMTYSNGGTYELGLNGATYGMMATNRTATFAVAGTAYDTSPQAFLFTSDLGAGQDAKVGVVVRVRASQTGNLQEWQLAPSTVKAYLSASGIFYQNGNKVLDESSGQRKYMPTTATSTATLTPAAGTDFYALTAQAVALALANPTGTWADGDGCVLRIKDDGTARALSFGTNYRAVGQAALPTTTVAGKTMYISIAWNNAEAKFDVFPAMVLP